MVFCDAAPVCKTGAAFLYIQEAGLSGERNRQPNTKDYVNRNAISFNDAATRGNSRRIAADCSRWRREAAMRGVWFLQAKQANMEYLGANGTKW